MKSPLIARPLASGMAVAAGLLRLFTLIPNFSPVGALSVYSGARLRGPATFIIPLTVMLVSNFFLHLLFGFPFLNATMGIVLVSFGINILLGRLLRRTENPLAIGGVTLIGAVQFFLLTNLGVWLSDSLYPFHAGGLLECYVAALPFFRYTLAGDLLFCGTLFVGHHLLARRFFPAETVRSEAIQLPV